jgi:hypothetical protein
MWSPLRSIAAWVRGVFRKPASGPAEPEGRDVSNVVNPFYAPQLGASAVSPAAPSPPPTPAPPGPPASPGPPGAPAAPPAPPSPAQTDPEIEALDLAEPAKSGAIELKKKHPGIQFNSGRRTVPEQASAMAGNVVKTRTYIGNTYAASTARDELQKWVNDNPGATTQDQIATGLESIMSGWSAAKQNSISKHLTGKAFDVQPVAQNADAIKTDMKNLAGVTKFLPVEDKLVIWHAQF